MHTQTANIRQSTASDGHLCFMSTYIGGTAATHSIRSRINHMAGSCGMALCLDMTNPPSQPAMSTPSVAECHTSTRK